MEGKTLLIFGGTGSLGYELNKRYIDKNIVYNFSRDECKHWEMKLHFNDNKNMRFVIGNVADISVVEQMILRVAPHIIIIACAMKHIDQCEINTGESLKTNLLGTQNILNSVEKNASALGNLEVVVFVSSDKACSPVNNYGMCKALSETLIIEKAHYVPNKKFVNVRYGNVLNSRGSIVPLLHKLGQDPHRSFFTLTSNAMTRFVMTLEQSVDLIDYAINNGESGDTIVPQLVSMKIQDIMELFSEKYGKPIKITGCRSGEKILESLINKTQCARMIRCGDFMHIKSSIKYPTLVATDNIRDYNSTINPMSKQELQQYLIKLNLLQP
jgi:UDP-glucose 4-epimerase